MSACASARSITIPPCRRTSPRQPQAAPCSNSTPPTATGALAPTPASPWSRHIEGTYLSFLTKVDATNLIGRVSQHFNATSTFADASGNLIAADSRYNATASVPVVNFQAGINWNPPQIPYSSVFVGYVYEYWWDLGRNSNNPGSLGEMSNQGIVFRTEFHF